ncbi:hypothetical protein ACSS6W_004833 [Trichoderma asperelloides]
MLFLLFFFSPLPTAEALWLRKLRQRHHGLGQPDSVSEERGEIGLSLMLQLYLGLAESMLRCVAVEMRG